MKPFCRLTGILLSVVFLLPVLSVPVSAETDIGDAAITLLPQNYEYNGSAREPIVQIVLNGETLIQNQDYTVSFRDNVKKGTARADITGIGRFSGEVSKSFYIEPRSMGQKDLQFDELPFKSYDGTAAISFEAGVETVSDDQVTATCTAVLEDCYAGSGKTVEITSIALSGRDSDNYQLKLSYPITLYNGQITPREPAVKTEAELAAGGNTLDLNTLITDRGSGQTVNFPADLQTQGSTLTADGVLTSGESPETIRIPITMDPWDANGDGKPEYTLSQKAITVRIVEKQSQDPVTPEPTPGGQTHTKEDQIPLAFSGSAAVAYTDTLSLGVAGGSGTGKIVYTVRPVSGDASVDSKGVLTPKKAGVVWVTAQKKGDSQYADGVPVSLEVTILPAKLTVRVKDKTSAVGKPVPSLQSGDYEVLGLKSGESLKVPPTLSYDPQPDMSKPGTVAIRASGAEVPSTNYDPDITYKPGTFTITEAPLFTITLSPAEHGSLTADKQAAAENDPVSLTAIPDNGYECREITVKTNDGEAVPVQEKGEGVSAFSMPGAPVTVSAVFGPSTALLPFTDVQPSDWFYDSVAWAWRHGIMNGTADTLFSPDLTTSRGMIVTILYRLEGSPEAPLRSPFSDVPETAYYAAPVAWAAWNGIVTGYDLAAFGPDDPITREQMATILFRYADFRGMHPSAEGNFISFSDWGEVHEYARTAMIWANEAGLITGKGGGILAPGGPATRAQAAAILQRFATKWLPV